MSRPRSRRAKWLVPIAVISLASSACTGGTRPLAHHRHGRRQPSASSVPTAPPSTSAEGGTTPAAPTGAVIPQPPGALSVLTYGADPTGSRNSAPAIRQAIISAESRPVGIVYFPPGRYILSDNDNSPTDFSIDSHAVTVQGAGPSHTTIVQEAGAKAGRKHGEAIFVIKTGAGGQPGGGDGSSISGLTLDSASYDGGTPILDYANGTTISNDVVLGPNSSHQYNSDQFGVRVIAICNHHDLSSVHRVNNTVEDLTIYGQGHAGDTDLDISCQENAKVRNIADTGNGMDIYIVDGVQVTGLTFHPGSSEASPQPFVITAPANNVTITDVTTYGSGGKIEPSPNGYATSNFTLSGERMFGGPGYSLTIGDGSDLTITSSQLTGLALQPAHNLANLTVVSSVVGSVQCGSSGAIGHLTGIHC